jgi:hypothetical protein
MPFRFNPFTDRLDVVNSGGSGGGVATLTGNSGGAVGPDGSGNINVIGGSGTTVSGNAGTNTLTITLSAASFTWNTISASQMLASNNGYFCIGGGALSLSLPSVSAVGDTIKISLDGSTSFTVTQGAGQSIKFAITATTTGAGGSLGSTGQGDSIEMVCSVANLRWNVVDSEGNLTII